jgi:hypothetical protein
MPFLAFPNNSATGRLRGEKRLMAEAAHAARCADGYQLTARAAHKPEPWDPDRSTLSPDGRYPVLLNTMIDYNNRQFRYSVTAENGEGTRDTVFQYFQEDNLVWGTYKGGRVRFGSLLALADSDGVLTMRYQQVNDPGRSERRSLPQHFRDPSDGRLRLHESWKWVTGDLSSGTSVVEEVLRDL